VDKGIPKHILAGEYSEGDRLNKTNRQLEGMKSRLRELGELKLMDQGGVIKDITVTSIHKTSHDLVRPFQHYEPWPPSANRKFNL